MVGWGGGGGYKGPCHVWAGVATGLSNKMGVFPFALVTRFCNFGRSHKRWYTRGFFFRGRFVPHPSIFLLNSSPPRPILYVAPILSFVRTSYYCNLSKPAVDCAAMSKIRVLLTTGILLLGANTSEKTKPPDSHVVFSFSVIALVFLASSILPHAIGHPIRRPW